MEKTIETLVLNLHKAVFSILLYLWNFDCWIFFSPILTLFHSSHDTQLCLKLQSYIWILMFWWSWHRYAQQTDAGQETKCLILSPKALVNVKPNLQIIADDVKCTHGAAISGELDPNELFYFQARGINTETATDALLYFFGAHVIKRIPFKPISEKGLLQFKELLASSRQNKWVPSFMIFFS